MQLHSIVSRLATLPDPANVPIQEFEIGERVKCSAFTGTVVEYLPQMYADNLYRVAWDGDSLDRDFYPASSLNTAHTAERAA